MTPRERVLAALSRNVPDKVPKDLSWGFSPALLKIFKEKTGSDNPEEYFDIETRFVNWCEAKKETDFSGYFDNMPSGTRFTEWGTAWIPGTSPESHHFGSLGYPMKGLNSIHDLEGYPFPYFFEEYRYKPLCGKVMDVHRRNLAAAGVLVCTIFETVWEMRGMERLFEDFVSNQEFAEYLLDKVTDIRCKQAEIYAQTGIDILMLGDDIGMQDRMIMSPELWRKWFKGRLARVVQSARDINPSLHVFYHSDGAFEEVIPELIEIGINVLNPIQPECMDPVKLKKQYGKKLAFWGTIGTQTTFPFATPEEVKKVVKERIDTVGDSGGLLIGPTHLLEPEVPWENIVAFFEAVEEFGALKG